MARRVLRVERAGKVLASWALDGEPLELSLVEEGSSAVICAWRLRGAPDQRVDEPSLQRLLRAEDDDLTMPLPEPTETTGGALPETEEAPALPRAGKRPVPNLARGPAPLPTGLPSLGLGPAREPERELTLPPPEPGPPERELTLPAPEPSIDEPSLSLPAPLAPPPRAAGATERAPGATGRGPAGAWRGGAAVPATRPSTLASAGLSLRPLGEGRAPAGASPRPRPPTGAPRAPLPPAPRPEGSAPRAPLDPAASASRPAPPRAPAAPARPSGFEGRVADEEESFTAAALEPGAAAVGLRDFDLGAELAELPAPKPAEVWVRRRSEWRSGGQLSPGQRAVARGGWVRFGEDGVLVVDPGPTLDGTATLLDGAVVELAPGSGPRRLSAGASVLLREGDYGLYVRAEAPAEPG